MVIIPNRHERIPTTAATRQASMAMRNARCSPSAVASKAACRVYGEPVNPTVDMASAASRDLMRLAGPYYIGLLTGARYAQHYYGGIFSHTSWVVEDSLAHLKPVVYVLSRA